MMVLQCDFFTVKNNKDNFFFNDEKQKITYKVVNFKISQSVTIMFQCPLELPTKLGKFF